MQPIEASQFENLFEERLHLYDSDLEMLEQEQNEQDQIAARVREANRAFTKARKGDSSTKDREKALQELENGYLKYKEIISNTEVGRKFYNDLAKIVGRFREDTKAFIHQRRMEASQLESYVNPTLNPYLLPPWRQFQLLTTTSSDITNAAAMASLNISQPSFRPQHQLPPNHHPSPYTQPPPEPQLQQKPTPQPQPQLQPLPSRPVMAGEPLTAPQPTRASAVPPPVATSGIWSPEMGIRFGGAPAPASAAPSSTQPQTPGSAPMQGKWDPSRGVRFS